MALVMTQRESECEHCKAKDGCEAFGGSGSNVMVKALNTAEARVGDRVTISMLSSAVLKASFVIYMVPILALVGGIICGFTLAGVLPLKEEVVVGSLAGLALAGSFLWLRKKCRELAERPEFVPEITAKNRPSPTVPSGNPMCKQR